MNSNGAPVIPGDQPAVSFFRNRYVYKIERSTSKLKRRTRANCWVSVYECYGIRHPVNDQRLADHLDIDVPDSWRHDGRKIQGIRCHWQIRSSQIKVAARVRVINREVVDSRR